MQQTAEKLMTLEEFEALPDDGVERHLIQGKLYECDSERVGNVTIRNRFHTRVASKLCQHLENWIDQQAPPRGHVHVGEIGFVLRQNPDTRIGIDVAYVTAEVEAAQDEDRTVIVGIPTLAVEILSPSDRRDAIAVGSARRDRRQVEGLPRRRREAVWTPFLLQGRHLRGAEQIHTSDRPCAAG